MAAPAPVKPAAASPAKKFSPPSFTNISKSASDLFKKKFDDKKDLGKNVVKTTYKTASGLVLTTGGEFDSKNALTGNLKAKYAQDSWGEASGELSTAGPMKAELKLKKLVKGLTVTATVDTKESYDKKRFNSTTGKLGVEYTYDWVTAAASYESSLFKENAITGSAVIGVEGLSVGGEVKVDPSKTAKETKANDTVLEDYNVGAQYEGDDFTASAKTSEKCDTLTLQYVHKVNKDLQVGGQFSTKLATGDNNQAGLVTQIEVDPKTTVKLRASTGKTPVAAVAVEHRLENPKLAFGLASAWNLDGFSLPKPTSFGLSVHFGDFDQDK